MMEQKYNLAMNALANALNENFTLTVQLAEAKGMIAGLSAKIEELESNGEHTGTKIGTAEPVRADDKPNRVRKAKTA